MSVHVEDILSAPVVMLIEQVMGIADLKVPHQPDIIYPDGSLHYTSQGACDSLQFEFMSLGIGGCIEQSIMRGLAITPEERLFALLYPVRYFQKLTPVGFLFSAGTGQPITAEERRNPVSIMVEFKRALKPKERERYLAYLKTWAKSVEKEGIGGEGPAWIASKEIGFSQCWAWFDVDRSKAGLSTLNWLVLVHLNFGMAVSPVRSVLFNLEEKYDPRNTRNLIEEAEYVPLSEVLEASARPIDTETEGNDSQDERIDDRTYCWSFSNLVGMETPFSVDFDSTAEWESLEFTIELASNTTENERKYLCQFIESWQFLAAHGAFGGRGTPCCEPPAFLDDGRTLRFRVDMGDVDEIASMTPFFRGLAIIHKEMPILIVRVTTIT